MGAAESTRKLTIINEDTTGAIRISEAAARKIASTSAGQQPNQGNTPEGAAPQAPVQQNSNSQNYAAPLETLTLRKRHEEQLDRLEAAWNKQRDKLQQHNREIWSATTKRLNTEIESIETNYTKKNTYDPICPTSEKQVEECLRSNPGKSLQCSQQVREFVSCVDDAKLAALLGKSS